MVVYHIVYKYVKKIMTIHFLNFKCMPGVIRKIQLLLSDENITLEICETVEQQSKRKLKTIVRMSQKEIWEKWKW